MAMISTGDMRQYFMNQRNTSATKTELSTLVQELTSGRVSDLTAHLGSDQPRLASLDRKLELLATFSQSNLATSQLLGTMQTAMGSVDSNRSRATDALLTVTQASTEVNIAQAGSVAQSTFEAVVSGLNTRLGGRSVFGGNDLDARPLASADVMLADLKATVTGLTTGPDISAALDVWFDAPGGAFETIGYQGDTGGFLERSVSADEVVNIDLRADDPAFRNTLKAMALGVLAADTGMALDIETRRDMQQQAATALLGAAGSLAGVQGRVGFLEAQVDEAQTRTAAEETSFGIARNLLVSADPYETAVRLEAVQTQLETQFALTARLSRLSLAEYLR